ncbi:MAG: AI-2E family transporter [Gammaproteobacteria bacterium]|nr:MAG: AI-2E family transporter [Gammaproteobacteria bacterium]
MADLRLLNFAAFYGSLALTVYILAVGQALFVPLVIAIFISFILISVTRAFERIRIASHPLPRILALALAFAVTLLFFALVAGLVATSIQEMVTEAPRYQQRLSELFQTAQTRLAPYGILFRGSAVNIADVFTALAFGVSGLFGNWGLILVYVIFILLEARTDRAKLRAFCRDEAQFQRLEAIRRRIAADIQAYLKTKVFTSALTGILTYGALALYAVDFAPFWALLTFLLNFIPILGSMIAVAFPLLMVLIQYGSLADFLTLAALLIGIQFTIGSILEPEIQGKSLNFSPLVILFALTFWGSIWGISGMFLSMPATVTIKIILANFPQTERYALLFLAESQRDSER